MTASQSPLPSGSDFVSATRTSCSTLSSTLGLTPNTAGIDAFLRTLSAPTFERLKTQHGLTFPLRFPTPLAELNFLSLLSLLNAYSGYRVAFHTQTGSGAYQNIVRLMMGLYISGGEDKVVGSKALTSRGMVELTEAKIVELLGVSVHEEREHETLKGVTVGVRGGDMLDCVQMILSTLQGVGKTLLEQEHASLGSYIASLLTQVKTNNLGDADATSFLVKSIAETLPEFCDTHTLAPSGEEVYLFKRIFFLLHSLRLRFADHPEWGVQDTTETLPMFVDNVLPTLCVWFHLLSVPHTAPEGMETLFHWVRTQHVDGELTREKLEGMQKNVAGPKLSADETYAIRAATLNVGRVVVERAKELAKEEGREWLEGLNEVDLDGYLWAVAKDDELLRKVPRLVFASIHF
ncbi:Protein of unknown function DUF2419 [Kalmanozyma brasiliensis GHG001]|uniref:Queuosine 5'-phosphate N-glycosylase/hydrolase n=1 Tax=Kalmanozyma brasiliensis (strain GHG001) TaxID=1365824 RepID=V5EYJ2_KALBG|nr:Protein of unknown function DUF2419 [Kalmanozyma brasiliensis GHG001]EST08833.1 Protein of unknown function DUF2419 [Kalmanozyma brasiliensis GHG001]